MPTGKKETSRIEEINSIVEITWVTCPRCGSDVEIWSAGVAACLFCGFRIFSKEQTIH